MERYCLVCGREISRRNKKFCGYKCAGLYKQNYAVCPVCGKIFKHSPSDTTTYTCGRRKCKKQYRSSNTLPERISAAHSELKTNPRTGHFETHHKAEKWHIVSPDGTEYCFKNLVLWTEQHDDLLPVSQRTGRKVSGRTFLREMQRLKSGNGKGACLRDNYHGWKIIRENCKDD